MIVAIIYLIISFILEGFLSNIFPSTLSNISYFTTIYTIISLVVIYPYFYNHKKYYILLIIFGLLFDIVYTSTFLLNTVIFIIIGITIKILNNMLSENIIMTNIISIITITLYHILSYLILSIVNYLNYDIMLLLSIILHSLIMTVIYTSVSYLILKLIHNKLEIKQIK